MPSCLTIESVSGGEKTSDRLPIGDPTICRHGDGLAEGHLLHHHVLFFDAIQLLLNWGKFLGHIDVLKLVAEPRRVMEIQ